jgi:hypothetical protein
MLELSAPWLRGRLNGLCRSVARDWKPGDRSSEAAIQQNATSILIRVSRIGKEQRREV